jgi:D-alanine--poly(phosphoribitol) ligase subunit 2
MAADPELIDRIGGLIRHALSVEVPAPDTDLIETGLIDSLALVSLIAEIEGEFGFELPLDDFDVDNFRTVDRIAEFVAAAGFAGRA